VTNGQFSMITRGARGVPGPKTPHEVDLVLAIGLGGTMR
jgi:hypothetical protein